MSGGGGGGDDYDDETEWWRNSNDINEVRRENLCAEKPSLKCKNFSLFPPTSKQCLRRKKRNKIAH